AFFQIGETKIELLESTHPEGPVAKFIEKRGEGIHHIAFKTNDVNSSLKELKEKNVKLIDENLRKGAEQLDIGFIHPKSAYGVLIEICS
ncbi:MAG: VOC family protein, partial [Ignavibacteriaceae bacterium]